MNLKVEPTCLSPMRVADFHRETVNGVTPLTHTPMSNLPGYDLDHLRDHVLRMGGAVEHAIAQATRALLERDSALAETVLRDDDHIDALELEADQLCIALLARPSANAHELRVVVTAIKLTPILERSADHA